MNAKVDWFFTKNSRWQQHYYELRMLLLECGLTEELKWGCPCYTYQNSNIVLIHGFKDYCALLFMQGALLKDDSRILVQQTVNVQAARQIRFTKIEHILTMQATLRAYLLEAINLEKAGLKVVLKKTEQFCLPEEFEKILAGMPALKSAFYALTPGRQRAYLLYFSAPKQAKTRESRIEKSISSILSLKGLDD